MGVIYTHDRYNGMPNVLEICDTNKTATSFKKEQDSLAEQITNALAPRKCLAGAAELRDCEVWSFETFPWWEKVSHLTS